MNKKTSNLAAAYVRVSTTLDSQKMSPEHQIGEIKEKASMLGLEMVATYEDRSSGTSITKREDVQKMIRDAKEGRFHTAIFASLSRFARDTYDSLGMKRLLVDSLGIRLISLDENYDSEMDMDEFKFQIFSAVNQKLSEQISVSTRRGLRQSGFKGNYIGGIPPYGYKRVIKGERKTLDIDESEAEAVRLIFHLYTKENYGLTRVRNYLNEQTDHKPRKADAWGLVSLQRIIQNPVYTGRNVFFKYKTVKVYKDNDNLSNRESKKVVADRKDWLETEFKTHPAIISDKQFEEAQKMRVDRSSEKWGGARQQVNIFRGIAFCSHCKSPMNMSTVSTVGKYRYRYMRCSKRRIYGDAGCVNGKSHHYNKMRDAVIDRAKSLLEKWVDVDESLKQINKHARIEKRDDNKKEIDRIEKEIDFNRKALLELRKQLMKGDIDQDQFEFEKTSYEEDINELSEKLSRLKEQVSQLEESVDLQEMARNALDELVNMDYEDADKLNLIFKEIFDRIEVSKDKGLTIYTPFGDS